jgi:hypothetical protein
MGRVGVLLLFLGLVGCASVPTPTSLAPVPAEEVKELAGAWQGWLVTERSFALFTLVITDDGTFEVTGQWTKARGVLLVADGTLRFDGTGAWRGTLAVERRRGERALRVERDDRLVRGYLRPIARDGQR